MTRLIISNAEHQLDNRSALPQIGHPMPIPAVRFGIKPPQQHVAISTLRQHWSIAEAAGFDHCWTFDHFAPMGPNRHGDVFEAWTLLAAMAQATSKIRIGCLVTGTHYRHPAVLVKMAATVDHLSGGRLELGLGAGGDPVDASLGLPVTPSARERIARLDEACQVLDSLFRQPSTTFNGRFHQLDAAESEPKPVQSPRPPLWIGSSGERYGLDVVARHADVWISAALPGTSVAEQARLGAVLDEHCVRVGRKPDEIRRAAQFRLPEDDKQALALVSDYRAAGFSELILMTSGTGEASIASAKRTAGLLPKFRALG
jgi:alkanesulfonate monooxygenase SsuD/methylene tetrahydromethanopterin reductase-like flavin-dependent oxidoreductase (luciferase family)